MPMTNPLASFSSSLQQFPKGPNDLSIVCAPTYAQYQGYVIIMRALLYPQAIVKALLDQAISAMNEAFYKEIIQGLNALDSMMKSILPNPLNLKMDLHIAKFGALLTDACPDFLSSIQPALFNVFQDLVNGITDLNEAIGGLMTLPAAISNSIVKSLIDLKDDAMKSLLGVLFDTILAPLIAYDAFLQSNGVWDIIRKMEITESCMTKPGICNRPRKDFIDPSSKLVYSVLFKREMMLDSKGNINITAMNGTAKQKSQMSNVMKNLNSFRTVTTIT